MLHRTRHLFPVTTIQHEGSFVKIDAVGDPPLGRCARYKNRVIVPKSNRSKSRAGGGSKIGSGRVRGRNVRPTIGRVDLMSLKDARSKTKEMMVEFSGGIDPRAAKTSGDGVTLREALNTYLNLKSLKPRSKEEMRAIIERHLNGWLDLSLWSISRGMVEQRHKQIAQDVEQCHRAKAAQHAKRHLAKAERTEVHWPEAAARHRSEVRGRVVARTLQGPRHRERSHGGTARDLEFHGRPRRRCRPSTAQPGQASRAVAYGQGTRALLRDGDLPAFYRATMALENPVARDYILLILFAGLRRREASSLRWKEDIDLQGRIIHISATNTKSTKNPICQCRTSFTTRWSCAVVLTTRNMCFRPRARPDTSRSQSSTFSKLPTPPAFVCRSTTCDELSSHTPSLATSAHSRCKRW
jgi:integrase